MKTKYHRVADANAVIRTIASYGRRFFYNAEASRYGVAGRIPPRAGRSRLSPLRERGNEQEKADRD